MIVSIDNLLNLYMQLPQKRRKTTKCIVAKNPRELYLTHVRLARCATELSKKHASKMLDPKLRHR